MLAMAAALLWLTTRRGCGTDNGFSWAPIVEVAVLFAGIFVTMVPALAMLKLRGASSASRSPGSISGPPACSRRSSTTRRPT